MPSGRAALLPIGKSSATPPIIGSKPSTVSQGIVMSTPPSTQLGEDQYDPNQDWTISAKNLHQNTDFSVFEGWQIQGKVETVLSRGRVVIQNGEHTGKQGDGQFIKRGTCVNL